MPAEVEAVLARSAVDPLKLQSGLGCPCQTRLSRMLNNHPLAFLRYCAACVAKRCKLHPSHNNLNGARHWYLHEAGKFLPARLEIASSAL